jgi:hypothetical protein
MAGLTFFSDRGDAKPMRIIHNFGGIEMWDEHTQARFQALRQHELDGALAAAEQEELRQMMQEIESAEAAYLCPATARLRVERERLEAQNRALQTVV